MALPNKSKIPVGTVLAGKYRVTRELGRGGMAAVYQAENVDIGKRVAVKVLAQELTTSAVVVERFLREARAAAAIRSPYICDIYDSGKLEDGRPFLVLELLEGESLYERMTKVRWFDVETTVSIISQTCRGLTKAHAASIVHRDLKPENIFLTKDEEGKLLAKILDFGLAKFYAPMESTGGKHQARLTREGAVFGTPAYMSPEQVRGQGAVDHRADLWALGCIVYECFTGRTVWATDQGVAMTFAQIANSPLPKPNQFRPDLPPAFTGWFERALHREIDQRFQSAKELAEELSIAFKQGQPSFSAVNIVPSLSDPATPEPPAAMNPFLSGPGDAPHAFSDAPSAPVTERRVSPDAATMAPATESHPQGPPAEPPHGPLSPRTSKMGFAAPDAAHRTGSRKRMSTLERVALGTAVVLVLGGGGYAGWTQLADLQKPAGPASSATASASSAVAPAPPDAAAPTATVREPAPASAALPWIPIVRGAQEMIARGDLKGAAKQLKEALDKGGHGVPRTMWEDVTAALGGAASAPCRLSGLGRPRTFDLVAGGPKPGNAGHPSIVVGPQGAVVVWTDAHEGAEHAYSVLLDEALRNVGVPVDITPEGTQVVRPELTRAGDKLVLTYGDAKGPEAGVKARFLDAEGHIAGAPVNVSPTRGHALAPSAARAPDGSFFIAWSDEQSSDSEDLFLRHMNPALEPLGAAARMTDLVPAGPGKPRARLPSIAVESGAVLAAYRMERDPVRAIHTLRVALADSGKGLDASKKGARSDRVMGESSLVNTDKTKGDAPSIACGSGACFLVWHGESGAGASAAFLDPAKSQPLWRRKFSKTGGRPAVSVAPGGQAQVVWFETKSMLTATINRDGLGPATKIARISSDQPPPSVAPGGKPGEWFLSWLDYESGHVEAYVARVTCK